MTTKSTEKERISPVEKALLAHVLKLAKPHKGGLALNIPPEKWAPVLLGDLRAALRLRSKGLILLTLRALPSDEGRRRLASSVPATRRKVAKPVQEGPAGYAPATFVTRGRFARGRYSQAVHTLMASGTETVCGLAVNMKGEAEPWRTVTTDRSTCLQCNTRTMLGLGPDREIKVDGFTTVNGLPVKRIPYVERPTYTSRVRSKTTHVRRDNVSTVCGVKAVSPITRSRKSAGMFTDNPWVPAPESAFRRHPCKSCQRMAGSR